MAVTGRGGAARALDRWQGGARLAFLTDAVLASYAQILFGRGRGVGLLLAAATLIAPLAGAHGALAVAASLATAGLLQLDRGLIRAGLLSYNGLLVGLALGTCYQPSPALAGLVVVAAALSVVVTATLRSMLGTTFDLPVLTLPFLAVTYLTLALAPQVAGLRPALPPSLAASPLPAAVAGYLRCLGALFFAPTPLAGLLVALALLRYSRIGVLLSLLGYGVAAGVGALLVAPSPALQLTLGYNLALVAVALGGVWFVPTPAAFALAGLGALFGAVLTLGGQGLLAGLGTPVLILPFNLTLLVVLTAMRQRVRDAAPSAAPQLGPPEHNLAHQRAVTARFGELYGVRFALPFHGAWRCTQAVDGPHTHQGPWRHGFDFEVDGPDGRAFRGDGRQVGDYACYGLPVLAPADGVVVTVVNDVPDNAIGEVDTERNWGNLVLLHHAPGLYSLVCHLIPGSIDVREGAPVRRGDRLGRCGNSGRSPVPHLHVHLQGSPRIGSPTLPCRFGEVVDVGPDGQLLQAACEPAEGQTLRNLVRDEAAVRRLGLGIGDALVFETAGDGLRRPRRETVRVELDLLGNLLLRTGETGDEDRPTLHVETREAAFTVYGGTPADSVLSLLLAALPRLPLEADARLRWHDRLPAPRRRGPLGRVLADLVAPLDPRGGLLTHDYTLTREADRLVVTGASRRRGRDGRPWVGTRAELADGRGLVALEQRVDRRVLRAVRCDGPPPSHSNPPGDRP